MLTTLPDARVRPRIAPRGRLALPTLSASVVLASLSGALASEPPTPGSSAGPAVVKSSQPEKFPSPRLKLVHRDIIQDQGDWKVDYTLRNESSEGLILAPSDLSAQVDGWVSNSRVASHARPVRSTGTVSASTGAWSLVDLVNTGGDLRQCKERVVLRLANDPSTLDAIQKAMPTKRPRQIEHETLATVSIPPGGTVRARLRLEHEHFLHGDYDPLLGTRRVEIRLAETAIKDVLALDRERYFVHARDTWREVPEDRRDTTHFRSGPDSLHLDAMVPGHQYYRFPERRMRYNTPVKLTFWYLISPHSEGEVRVHLGQYRESVPWSILSEGCFEQPLTVAGRWMKYEKCFRTEAEATTLGLDFRITGDVGEAWIDDVRLEPVKDCPKGP